MQPGKSQEINVLCLDIVGYSRLDEQVKNPRDVKTFHEELLLKFYERNKIGIGNAEFINTWGDGIIIIHDDIKQLTDIATNLQEMLTFHTYIEPNEIALDFLSDSNIKARIALSRGEVYCYNNFLYKDSKGPHRNDYYGNAIVLAARIEPQTVPGAIFVTEKYMEHMKDKIEDKFLKKFHFSTNTILNPFAKGYKCKEKVYELFVNEELYKKRSISDFKKRTIKSVFDINEKDDIEEIDICPIDGSECVRYDAFCILADIVRLNEAIDNNKSTILAFKEFYTIIDTYSDTNNSNYFYDIETKVKNLINLLQGKNRKDEDGNTEDLSLEDKINKKLKYYTRTNHSFLSDFVKNLLNLHATFLENQNINKPEEFFKTLNEDNKFLKSLRYFYASRAERRMLNKVFDMLLENRKNNRIKPIKDSIKNLNKDTVLKSYNAMTHRGFKEEDQTIFRADCEKPREV